MKAMILAAGKGERMRPLKARRQFALRQGLERGGVDQHCVG